MAIQFPKEYVIRVTQQYIKERYGPKATLRGSSGGSARSARTVTPESVAPYLEKIKQMFFDAVREVIPSFSHNYDDIYVTTQPTQNGGLGATISVNSNALHRASLHRMNREEYLRSGKLTIASGEGVRDIISLFVHGYDLKRRPFGYWVHDGGMSMERIGAKMHRDPNPFMNELVNRINEEYKGVCVATLDDNYR